jgi:hypothetical protein
MGRGEEAAALSRALIPEGPRRKNAWSIPYGSDNRHGHTFV